MADDIKCPECGSDTVERTAQKGPNAGHSFYVCTNYPTCKGKVEIRDEEDVDGFLENTSGQGSLLQIPYEIRGWSWGAFFLTWIWGIFNGVWLSLLVFVPYIGWVMAIVLGIKGKEWAWENKRWDSIEHFKRIQRSWAIWGLVFSIAFWGVIFTIIIAIAIAAILASPTTNK